MIFWNQFQYLLAWACGIFATGFSLLALFALTLLLYGAMVSAANAPTDEKTADTKAARAPVLSEGTAPTRASAPTPRRPLFPTFGKWAAGMTRLFSRRTPKS